MVHHVPQPAAFGRVDDHRFGPGFERQKAAASSVGVAAASAFSLAFSEINFFGGNLAAGSSLVVNSKATPSLIG